MIGEIKKFARLSMPDSVLACDGATYLKADYPLLWAYLGSPYEVSGTQFHVPDYRGKVLVMQDGADFFMDDTGGEIRHTLTVSEIPSHDHTEWKPSGFVPVVSPGELAAILTTEQTLTGMTGGGQSHENMPPYHAVQWGIVAK